jgi:zinc protease
LAAELKTLAEKEFGAWKEGEGAEEKFGEPEEPSRKIVVVDKPGAGQTQLRVGIVGVARATPDYAALEVMNATLGGVFSSRINMNLREEKGYTYGAYSGFAYRRAAGPFLVRAGVRTDATAPSVTEIFKEIGRITAEPVSADELSLSRDALSLSLPGRFETTFQTVNSFANVFIYDLGADYYSRLPGMLREVTAENVETVAKKYLVPGKMVVVAVGDRARIEPELKKLGLGAIELRDAEGERRE